MKMRADGVSFPRSPPGPAHGAYAPVHGTPPADTAEEFMSAGSGSARMELAVIISPLVQVIIS